MNNYYVRSSKDLTSQPDEYQATKEHGEENEHNRGLYSSSLLIGTHKISSHFTTIYTFW